MLSLSAIPSALSNTCCRLKSPPPWRVSHSRRLRSGGAACASSAAPGQGHPCRLAQCVDSLHAPRHAASLPGEYCSDGDDNLMPTPALPAPVPAEHDDLCMPRAAAAAATEGEGRNTKSMNEPVKNCTICISVSHESFPARVAHDAQSVEQPATPYSLTARTSKR